MRAHLRRPRDLSDDERAAWCAMQDHQAAYQTPFLSPQHALVADTVMDDVWVLVISDDHGPTAFLPLQRTGDRGRPLLDACNDGDGMVQRRSASLDVSGALRQVGLASFTFGHTPVVADGLCRFHEARALSSIVDLPFGFEDYAQQLRDRGSSVLSEAARKARRLAREEGDLRFEIDVEEGDAAAILVRMKAEQLPPVDRERFLAAPVGEFITAGGGCPRARTTSRSSPSCGRATHRWRCTGDSVEARCSCRSYRPTRPRWLAAHRACSCTSSCSARSRSSA